MKPNMATPNAEAAAVVRPVLNDMEKVEIRRQDSINNDNNVVSPATRQRTTEIIVPPLPVAPTKEASTANIYQTLNNNPVKEKSVRELFHAVLNIKANEQFDPKDAVIVKAHNTVEFRKAMITLNDAAQGKPRDGNMMQDLDKAITMINWLHRGKDYGDVNTAREYNQLMKSFVALVEKIAERNPADAQAINRTILPMKTQLQFNAILNEHLSNPDQAALAKNIAKQFDKFMLNPDLNQPHLKELKDFFSAIQKEKPAEFQKLANLLGNRNVEIVNHIRAAVQPANQARTMEAVAVNVDLSAQKAAKLQEMIVLIKNPDGNIKNADIHAIMRKSKSFAELVKAVEKGDVNAIHNIANDAYDKRQNAGVFARAFKFDKESSQHYQALCKEIVDNLKNPNVDVTSFAQNIGQKMQEFTGMEMRYQQDVSAFTYKK